jgi:hypothetical protein
MKQLILALALLVGFNAQAVLFKNSSDTVLGNYSKVKCGTNMTCAASSGYMNISLVAGAFTGDISGDGGDQLYGFLQNQIASSTTSLTAAQCGSTVVSNSADVVTLPEASTVLGCRYTFVCGTADDFDVNPADGTDQIGTVSVITGTNTTTVLAPAAGDAIRCTDIGSSFTLEAVGANLWASIGAATGIITDVN